MLPIKRIIQKRIGFNFLPKKTFAKKAEFNKVEDFQYSTTRVLPLFLPTIIVHFLVFEFSNIIFLTSPEQ